MQSVEQTPRRGLTRWRWAAAALVVLVAGLAAAWWLLWSTPVVATGGYGVGFHDVEAGQPYTIGIDFLCLDGAGTVVVEDVTVDDFGLAVVDFAVRPRPEPPAMGFGAQPATLAETGFGDARSFSGQCDTGAYTELAVELTARAVPGYTEDIDIHWSAGLRSGVVTVPVSVALCPSVGDPMEACAGAA